MSKEYKIEIDVQVDGQFWALLPALNVNLHNGITIEFEWICVGLYFRRVDKTKIVKAEHFYCELDGNFAHNKCKKQCKHCENEIPLP